MKKTLLAALLLLAANTTQAQKTEQEKQLHEMDSTARMLIADDKFDKAVDAFTAYTAKVKGLRGEADTTYIEGLVFLGKAYLRAKRINRAVETAQKVVDLYGKHFSTKDKRYAWYLDNLSLYLTSNGKSKEALVHSKKALKIYESLYTNDRDMAVILIHAAENSFHAGEKAEAIKYQLRALSIYKDLFGQHSEEYTDEAEYLISYYEGNNQEDKAKSLRDEVEKLKEEAKKGYGDIPELPKLETAEDCRKHTKDVERCCQYYLSHRLTAHDMDDAAKFIMAWAVPSDLVTIPMGKNEAQLISTEKSYPYLFSYYAGYILYALENKETKESEDGYEAAMVATLNHYLNNKDLTGPVPTLEKYVKLYKKDKDKMFAQIRKNFPKIDKEDKNKKE